MKQRASVDNNPIKQEGIFTEHFAPSKLCNYKEWSTKRKKKEKKKRCSSLLVTQLPVNLWEGAHWYERKKICKKRKMSQIYPLVVKSKIKLLLLLCGSVASACFSGTDASYNTMLLSPIPPSHFRSRLIAAPPRSPWRCAAAAVSARPTHWQETRAGLLFQNKTSKSWLFCFVEIIKLPLKISNTCEG